MNRVLRSPYQRRLDCKYALLKSLYRHKGPTTPILLMSAIITRALGERKPPPKDLTF